MEGLFSPRAFQGFGPCALDPEAGSPPVHMVHASRSRGLRARVRLECPRRPGVYGMVDGEGRLLYVGKAKCLRTRLFSYFRTRRRDPRAGKILEHARTLVWEYVPHEFAALLRELELIRRWQPRLNIQGQPRRQRRVYVCLGGRPAAYVFVTSRPSARAIACFGPVPASRLASDAVRRINDGFQLRDCPEKQEMIFADEQELFPVLRPAGCMRLEIGACLGPCAAACTYTAYAAQVQAAWDFLKGSDRSLLDQLESTMREAAAAQAFERAAALRDKLAPLQWLHQHLERLRIAREQYSFIYRVSGHGGGEWWYVIRQGRVAAASPAPHDKAAHGLAAKRIEALYAQRMMSAQPALVSEMAEVLLVASWFRKYPEELDRVIDPLAALAACRHEQGSSAVR